MGTEILGSLAGGNHKKKPAEAGLSELARLETVACADDEGIRFHIVEGSMFV